LFLAIDQSPIDKFTMMNQLLEQLKINNRTYSGCLIKHSNLIVMAIKNLFFVNDEGESTISE